MPVKKILKRLLQLLVLCTAVALVYFTYTHAYGRQLELYLALYSLSLLYHITIDDKRSKLFVYVLGLLVISAILGVLYFYEPARPRPDGYVYVSNLFSFFAFLLMFVRLFKEYPPKFEWSWRSLWIIGIILINLFIGYKIVELVQKFNLSFEHFFFGFFYTLFKMVLLSAGLILYYSGSGRTRKLSFLVGAFFCFFISDIIDTLNSLVFMKNPIPGGDILFSGLFCIGLFFFYMYCITQRFAEPLEKERYI